MSHTPTVFPPSSLQEVLEELGELKDDAFKAFADDVRRNGFEARKRRCSRLAELTDLSAESVVFALNALNYLYNRLADASGEEVKKALGDVIDKTKADSWQETLAGRLTSLIARSDEIDLARKASRLRAGFLKTATSFGTFLDVRPDYGPGNEEIRSLVPVIQFRITTDADSSNEKSFVFQLDEGGLEAMKEAIADLEKKLLTLFKSDSSLQKPFVRNVEE